MIKREIIEELKKYGINTTLRARKSTLEALLEEKREDAENTILKDRANKVEQIVFGLITILIIALFIWA